MCAQVHDYDNCWKVIILIILWSKKNCVDRKNRINLFLKWSESVMKKWKDWLNKQKIVTTDKTSPKTPPKIVPLGLRYPVTSPEYFYDPKTTGYDCHWLFGLILTKIWHPKQKHLLDPTTSKCFIWPAWLSFVDYNLNLFIFTCMFFIKVKKLQGYLIPTHRDTISFRPFENVFVLYRSCRICVIWKFCREKNEYFPGGDEKQVVRKTNFDPFYRVFVGSFVPGMWTIIFWVDLLHVLLSLVVLISFTAPDEIANTWFLVNVSWEFLIFVTRLLIETQNQLKIKKQWFHKLIQFQNHFWKFSNLFPENFCWNLSQILFPENYCCKSVKKVRLKSMMLEISRFCVSRKLLLEIAHKLFVQFQAWNFLNFCSPKSIAENLSWTF